MTRRPSPEEHAGKLFLFLGSCAVGIGASLLMYRISESVAWGITAGVVVGLANPFVAAAAVKVCEALHHWAFPDTHEKWSVEKQVGHGAAWPLTLLFWVVVSVFYAAINRLFSR